MFHSFSNHLLLFFYMPDTMGLTFFCRRGHESFNSFFFFFYLDFKFVTFTVTEQKTFFHNLRNGFFTL